ncbi:hypothetical protein [Streptomyces sp. PT12]|nr:hypothetical protein [Streptomyces sp. PT12]
MATSTVEVPKYPRAANAPMAVASTVSRRSWAVESRRRAVLGVS